ncbi:MAG: hypothetical protein IKF99_15745 [Oscillospiraceae bacterium]|nr:hypothetical protein [Oscillospiraceae bacterium]
MSLYTERNGMRKPVEKSYTVTIKEYSLLYDCCARYFDNLGWKYPDECPDGVLCCGMDFAKFNQDMEYEIPTLFRRDGLIAKPNSKYNIFAGETKEDEFDQFALFDLIEFVAQNIRDINHKSYHSYFKHYDLTFGNTNMIQGEFIAEINAIFDKTGLLYHLATNTEIERIEESAVLSKAIENRVTTIKEPGIRGLLEIAIQKHKSPYPNDQKDAVEKIWDALERLKTYYTTMDKKGSVAKIVSDMADGKAAFIAPPIKT